VNIGKITYLGGESNSDEPTGVWATVQRVTDAFRADTEVVASAVNYYELNAQNPEGAAGLVSADRTTTIIPVTLAGLLEKATENGADVLTLLHAQQEAAPKFTILTVGDGSHNGSRKSPRRPSVP